MAIDMGVISAIVSSLSSAKEIIGGITEARDAVKLNSIKFNLTNHIIDAQGKLLDAREILFKQYSTIESLNKRIAEMESDRTEKARYQLVRLGNRGDFFAYQLRPVADLKERQDEVPHFCCQSCFDTGKKVVLIGNGEGYWSCPVCKTATLGSGKIVTGPTRRSSITDGYF